MSLSLPLDGIDTISAVKSSLVSLSLAAKAIFIGVSILVVTDWLLAMGIALETTGSIGGDTDGDDVDGIVDSLPGVTSCWISSG